MKKAESLSADLLITESLSSSLFQEIANELETGVSVPDAKLVEFKVEQKITKIKGSSQFNLGGFVNSNAKAERMNTNYTAALLSDKYQTITNSDGEVLILKRYGIGFSLMLEVKDVETKINANYGVVAAAGALNLSKVAYKISVYGVLSPELVQYLPKQEGDFTNEVFGQIQTFFEKAKEHIGDMNNSSLYPIEIIKNNQIVPDKDNIKSIYFATRAVAAGKELSKFINEYQRNGLTYDNNVVQFVYNYFGAKNAFLSPSPIQQENAAKWLLGRYNKVEKTPLEGSWVEIDSSYVNSVTEASEYKPHPVPDNWATLGKVLEDETFEISANFSSEIKIAAMLNTSSDFNTYTLGRRIVHYLDTSDNAPEGSKVMETRYGIGIRVLMKISGLDFGTDISFANIGAIAELNVGNVEYEISGIGISDVELVKLLPIPQDINQDTFSEINKTIEDLKNKISELDPAEFEPQALRIRVEEPEKVDPTLKAQATVFAYHNVVEKERLNETLSKAKALGLPEEPIKEVYNDLDIEGNDRPRRSDKLEAKDWLDI